MIGWIAYLTLIVGAEPALAPPEPAAMPPHANRQAASASDPPSAAASTSRPEQPTAEDLLRALQRERPLNEVIPPRSAKGGEWPKTKRRLLPEGTTVIERSGSVVPDGDGWRFRFDDPSGDPSYRLLPNALLDVLIHAVDSSGERVRFVISGETTTFADENFLLLRGASRTAPPTGVPASRASVPSAAVDADPVDVLRVLSSKDPTRTLVPSAPPSGGDAVNRRGQRIRTLLPDGSPLVDRPGRVLREGSEWVFVPETDRADRPEPTLRLLPNRSTELIAKSHGAETTDTVFVLSGEITQFQGENYLLPRAVVRRMSTDNLRK